MTNNAMKTEEMRELDEFCAVEVMGWKKINPHAETSCECADFSPTNDAAAAMMVWRKCLDRPERPQIFASKDPNGFYWVRTAASGKHCEGKAPILELAIVKLARQLFSK